MAPQEKPDGNKLASIQEVLAKVEHGNILERLFAKDENVVNLVFSDDKELKPDYVPEPIYGLFSEQEIIIDLLNNPLIDLGRITERQDVVEALKDFESLDQLINFKNSSYLIEEGVSTLFSPFEVAEHQSFPALDAYRMPCWHNKPGLEEIVMAGLEEITKGKIGLQKLIKTFSEIDQPIVKEMTEVLKKDFDSIKHFGEKYFLYEDYDSDKTEDLSDITNTDLKHCGVMAEYSNICAKDEYCKAGFNGDEPEGYVAGWNFSRLKKGREPQILNDSAEDKPLTILTGANMGGKSFNLVQNFHMQRLAQSFGFVPAQKANFEIYDSFFYLDRAATESKDELSAYGAEVVHLGKALQQMGKKVFLVTDECFSTTSDEDRYCLLRAVTDYLADHNGKTFLSTHSEMFIKKCADDPRAGIYHLPFTIDKTVAAPEIKIDYSHKLTKGPGDPRALEVASSMNLPKGLMDFAKDYINGILEEVEPPKDRTYKEIVSYTEEEREAKKKETKYISIFADNSENVRVFQKFSEDNDFKKGSSGWSNIVTGESSYNGENEIYMGGWHVESVAKRKGLLFDLLTQSKELSSQEIIERQKMFEELSKNDRYEDFKEMGDKMTYMLKFLPKYESLCGSQGFLEFNTVWKPIIPDGIYDESIFDHCQMFLKFNQKILGKDFSPELLLLMERLNKGKEFFNYFDQYIDNRDVFEIEQGWQNCYDEEITNKKVIDKYLEFTSDEPNKEKWEGKLTPRRIKAYMLWLEEHNYERWQQIDFELGLEPDPLLRVIKTVKQRGYPFSITNDHNKDFDAKGVSEKYYKIANGLESEKAKEKWGNKVCVKRILELIECLKQKTGFDNEISVLKEINNNIYGSQTSINIFDKGIREMMVTLFDDVKKDPEMKITKSDIHDYLRSLFEPFSDIEKILKMKPIFECDLESITPEIRYFAQYYKKKYKKDDFEYHNNWSHDLLLSLILEMFIDKEYEKEFPKLLRSYDSVYLHQLANYFDGKVKGFGPKKLFGKLKTIYERKTQVIVNDYFEIEKCYKEIFDRYSIIKDIDDLKKIKEIIEVSETNNAYQISNILDSFKKITNIDALKYFTSKNYGKDYQNFYKIEIIDSGLKEKMEKFLAELDESYELIAKPFIKKYKIKFKDYSENDISQDVTERIKDGILWDLKREIFHKNQNAVYGTHIGEFNLAYEDDSSDWSIEEKDKKLSINNRILEAQAMGLFGHMINTHKFNKVIYNTNGEVDFQKMFNMFEPKSIQKLNDAHFDRNNEIIRLVAAANMSGKTYHLKSLTMALLSALNTGYAPAEMATTPLFNNILYLDRITTKSVKSLSSFGNEVEVWKKFFGVFDKKEKNAFVVANVDEAFSTTSDVYQTPFVYALIMEMMKRGQYMEVASHNHKVFNILRKLEEEFLKAYTFDINIRPDGKVNFHHQMRELEKGEKTFSEAIAVARTVGGLPEEILDAAEKIKKELQREQNGRVDLL